MLDRDHAPAGEAAAVAAAVHLEHDRHVEVAAAQEIRVQRVHLPALHRARGGHQRLPEHLAAEHLRRADVAALAAKQVVLDPLEVEQLQQLRQARWPSVTRHSGGATPSRSCMIGLVVVYCRNCLFSG